MLRIAIVGDSFVGGEGVPVELTLPRQTEQILGEGFQVINAGHSGYDTTQELQMLTSVAADYHCSRAIVVFIANDVQMTPKLAGRQKYINDLINIRDRYLDAHEKRAWYRGHSRILDLVGSSLEMRKIEHETLQWYRDCYNPQFNSVNLRLLELDLKRMARTPGCRVAFVMYPLLIGLEAGTAGLKPPTAGGTAGFKPRSAGEYPLQEVHDKVGRMAEEAGMPVLDLAQTFRGMRTSSLHAYPTDHHPNGKAHAIAAKAIVDWLHRDVPGFLKPEP
jgi:lysophospholipase L1-like esterase